MPNLVTLRKDPRSTRSSRSKPFALLAGRLGVGLVFVSTGWGKIHNLEGRHQVLHRARHPPRPASNALLASVTELVCGAAPRRRGDGPRLATIPLIVTMIVAILTAKRKDLPRARSNLVGFDEFTYIVVMFMNRGPRPWSATPVDHLLARKFGGASEKP